MTTQSKTCLGFPSIIFVLKFLTTSLVTYLIAGKAPLTNEVKHNTFSFECNEFNPLYTITKNGSVGVLFKQTSNFITTCDVITLKKINCNIKFNETINLSLITLQLTKIFNWQNKLTNQKFNDIEVYIYVN